MKSRTSLCNTAVLKKDLTRFFPVWLIYLIGGLLVCTAFTTESSLYRIDALDTIIVTYMPLINCGYGLVVALLLFGDLFNSRMCNALHAMPLRRETWFGTHVLAGLLMSVLPNALLALVLMTTLEGFWYAALLWLAASVMMFLFFFALAVLCALACGNRFGAILVYGLVNVFSMELLWMYNSLILPSLYGVMADTNFLYYLAPVVGLMMRANYMESNIGCDKTGISYHVHDSSCPTLSLTGSSWLYLGILAAVGLVLLVLALVLYRRRKLETAGDFAAIAPVKWLIAIFGSLACGMLFRLFLYDSSEVLGTMALFFGIAVGFFLLEMLLQRTVKVFVKPILLKCLCLLVAAGLALTAGAVDILGIERYIPKSNQVEKVLVYDGKCYLSYLDNLAEYYEDFSGYYNCILSDDPECIEDVRSLHKQALEEGEPNSYYRTVTIRYYLKNGQTVTRAYQLAKSGQASQAANALFNDPVYTLGVNSAEELYAGLTEVAYGKTTLEEDLWADLADLLWRDLKAGTATVSDVYNDSWVYGDDYYYVVVEGYSDPDLRLEWTLDGKSRQFRFQLSSESGVYDLLRENLPQPNIEDIFGVEQMEDMLDGLNIHWSDYGYLDDETCQKLLKALWTDAQEGLLFQSSLYHEGEYYTTLSLSWASEVSYYDTYCTIYVWTDCVNTMEALDAIASGDGKYTD